MLQLHFKDQSKKALWLVEPRYSIGSGSSCSLTITDRRLQAHHAELQLNGDVGLVTNLVGDSEIRVNGIPVSGSHKIAHGDVLGLGLTELDVIDPKLPAKARPASDTKVEEAAAWVLKPVSQALGTREYPVAQSAVLGRSRECDISLGVAHLSRQHARVTVTERGLQVEDLDSANGTYVNGQRIKKAMLKPGDQLSFDTVKFQVSGPQIDLEATTVRPVISVQQRKTGAPEAKPRANRPVNAQRQRQAGNPPRPQPGMNADITAPIPAASGGGVITKGLIALAIGAVIYYMWQNQWF